MNSGTPDRPSKRQRPGKPVQATAVSRLEVRYRAVDQLRRSPRNARTHSPQQVRQIAAAITEFGWTNPILLGEQDDVIAGHGRLEAAALLGMADVPTIALTGLSEPQKRALALADNKLALNAGWDEDMLRIELGDLKMLGFDVGVVGFDDAELAAIFDGGAARPDPDDVPALPETAISRPGDVWLLGASVVCPHCNAHQPAAEAATGE